jgi:transcriptional regulator with XRE-family HTH domain
MAEAVGKRLKRLLDEKLDGNQSELARRSGVDRAYISQIIGGRTADMRLETAHALARGLGVPVSQLIDEAPAGSQPPDPEALLRNLSHWVREMGAKDVRYLGSVPTSKPAPEFLRGNSEHVMAPQIEWKEGLNVFAVKVGDASLEESGIAEGTTVVLESATTVDEGQGVYLVLHGGVVMLRILSRTGERISVTPPLPDAGGPIEYTVLGRGRWRDI